jgi:hypothetical protein
MKDEKTEILKIATGLLLIVMKNMPLPVPIFYLLLEIITLLYGSD